MFCLGQSNFILITVNSQVPDLSAVPVIKSGQFLLMFFV